MSDDEIFVIPEELIPPEMPRDAARFAGVTTHEIIEKYCRADDVSPEDRGAAMAEINARADEAGIDPSTFFMMNLLQPN